MARVKIEVNHVIDADGNRDKFSIDGEVCLIISMNERNKTNAAIVGATNGKGIRNAIATIPIAMCEALMDISKEDDLARVLAPIIIKKSAEDTLIKIMKERI